MEKMFTEEKGNYYQSIKGLGNLIFCFLETERLLIMGILEFKSFVNANILNKS